MTGAWRPSLGRGLLTATILIAGAGGCSLPGHGASPPATTAAPTTIPAASTTVPSTTIPGVQSSGARTVLSPIGLNVRAQPLASASVVGTAAQGVVFSVLGYTAEAGGWYQVRGATVTGWVSARPTLSAPGAFKGYTSAPLNFTALYPATWTVKEVPNATDFTAPAGGGDISVVLGPSVAALPKGQAGYTLSHSEQIVVCGVTTYLDSYSTAAAGGAYLAQISLPLDATHAMGIEGTLTNPSQLGEVRTFAVSVSFPYPECQGG